MASMTPRAMHNRFLRSRDTFHDLIGTHYQQDVDLNKLFMDVAAYSQRVMGPAHVVNIVDQAIRTALAWRTVSHITIPKDMQECRNQKMNDPPRISCDRTVALTIPPIRRPHPNP